MCVCVRARALTRIRLTHLSLGNFEVPHCSMANAGSCQTSYIIHRGLASFIGSGTVAALVSQTAGVGFRCRWNQELKPAAQLSRTLREESYRVIKSWRCFGYPIVSLPAPRCDVEKINTASADICAAAPRPQLFVRLLSVQECS